MLCQPSQETSSPPQNRSTDPGSVKSQQQDADSSTQDTSHSSGSENSSIEALQRQLTQLRSGQTETLRSGRIQCWSFQWAVATALYYSTREGTLARLIRLITRWVSHCWPKFALEYRRLRQLRGKIRVLEQELSQKAFAAERRASCLAHPAGESEKKKDQQVESSQALPKLRQQDGGPSGAPPAQGAQGKQSSGAVLAPPTLKSLLDGVQKGLDQLHTTIGDLLQYTGYNEESQLKTVGSSPTEKVQDSAPNPIHPPLSIDPKLQQYLHRAQRQIYEMWQKIASFQGTSDAPPRSISKLDPLPPPRTDRPPAPLFQVASQAAPTMPLLPKCRI